MRLTRTFHRERVSLGKLPLGLELVGLLLLVLVTLSPGRAAAQTNAAANTLPRELRVGFQKSSVNLTLLKQRKGLEQRLPQVKVTWFEFNAGPQMLEALSVGSIDFAMTGDTPPIFAQAAGSHLVYVAAEPPKPDNSAVLVRADSPLRSLADLRGKRVAMQRGSSAHYLTLRALQSVGLQWSDISAVYLSPAEARAAFERGSVDAWVIWDPYWAAAESALKPRVLATSRGLVANYTFYLASHQLAERYPDVIQVLVEELTKSDRFVQQHHAEAVHIIAESIGLDQASADLYVRRRPRAPVAYLTPEKLEEQQRIADAFHKQNLIPRALQVREAFWYPAPR